MRLTAPEFIGLRFGPPRRVRATTTPSVVAFYMTMADTGCRPGELLGAPEDAVGFVGGILRVRRHLVRAGRQPVFGEPKTPAGVRNIKLSPKAIKAALLWKRERRLKMGPKFRDGCTLFCTERGRPIDRRVLRARDPLPRLVRLNLSDTHIYDLRHLNITYQFAGGTDLRTIADRARIL